jgi:type IV secretory pathway TraG/TraD family ATPase VirD4
MSSITTEETALRSETKPITTSMPHARGMLRWHRRRRVEPTLADRLAAAVDPAAAVREHADRQRAGAFLGAQGERFVFADREHAVLVLGAPRSGKTTAVVIPAILAAPGAVVATSTKPDVRAATQRARATGGRVWVFDPTGEAHDPAPGAQVLRWSPVAAATGWDEALHTARAMTLAAPALGRGTTHEQHWSERAAALLAPLLYAAHESDQPIDTVLRWVLCHEFDEPTKILVRAGEPMAVDVLYGISKTDQRERSSIFSAAAGVLALYNTNAARDAASSPNFNADSFAASTDTIYITAPAHRQALCAPLVVGLLEQIRHATYRRATGHPQTSPVFFCLDEVANIAPIHDLPALVSEAGGQGLHVMACLQDLSQARTRWGVEAADGFLTLFQTKLVLAGISDPHTLEALSVVLGEIDRPMPTTTAGVSETRTHGWMPPPPTTTRSRSVGYNTVRQRRVSPGEIAAISKGHGMLISGANRQRLRLTPYHACEPWRTLTQTAGSPPPPASYADRDARPSLDLTDRRTM